MQRCKSYYEYNSYPLPVRARAGDEPGHMARLAVSAGVAGGDGGDEVIVVSSSQVLQETSTVVEVRPQVRPQVRLRLII